MAESRISPHNLADLKNTTDDALSNYLRGLGFKQDNSKLDVRLAMGYISVVIAGVLFAADYKLGWEQTKAYTAPAVLAYALLNGAFTYWMWAVEKGCVFEGEKNGKKISIASKTKKHDPTYYLTVSVSDSKNSSRTQQIKTSFMTWFTADGYFVAKPFQQWLASSIEVIGEADTKNSKRDQGEALASTATEPAEIPSGNGAVQASGVHSGSKSSNKKTKRKG